jgi:hypothetical protein
MSPGTGFTPFEGDELVLPLYAPRLGGGIAGPTGEGNPTRSPEPADEVRGC